MQVGRTGANSGADLEVTSMHDLRRAMPGLWHERPHAGPSLGPAAQAAPAAGRPQLRRQSTADMIRNAADDEDAERGDAVPTLPPVGERGVLVPAQE